MCGDVRVDGVARAVKHARNLGVALGFRGYRSVVVTLQDSHHKALVSQHTSKGKKAINPTWNETLVLYVVLSTGLTAPQGLHSPPTSFLFLSLGATHSKDFPQRGFLLVEVFDDDELNDGLSPPIFLGQALIPVQSLVEQPGGKSDQLYRVSASCVVVLLLLLLWLLLLLMFCGRLLWCVEG